MAKASIILGAMVFLLLGIIVFLDDGQHMLGDPEICVPTRLNPFC